MATSEGLHVALVAADRQVWEGEASTVIARTTEGDLGVLPGHEPVFSVLVPGLVQVRRTGAEGPLLAAVDGGFLSVSDDRISVLAESVFLAEDLDEAAVRAELNQAERGSDPDELRRAQARAAVVTGQLP